MAIEWEHFYAGTEYTCRKGRKIWSHTRIIA